MSTNYCECMHRCRQTAYHKNQTNNEHYNSNNKGALHMPNQLYIHSAFCMEFTGLYNHRFSSYTVTQGVNSSILMQRMPGSDLHRVVPHKKKGRQLRQMMQKTYMSKIFVKLLSKFCVTAFEKDLQFTFELYTSSCVNILFKRENIFI